MPENNASPIVETVQPQSVQAEMTDQSTLETQLAASGAVGRRKLLKRLGYGVAAAGLSASLPLASALAEPPTASAKVGSVSRLSIGTTLDFNPNAQLPHGGGGPFTLIQTYAGYNFRPLESATGYASVAGGGIYWTGGGDPSFWCPIFLPQGSKVTNVTFYFTDNNTLFDIGLNLYIIDPNTLSSGPVFSLSSTGFSQSPRSLFQVGTPAAPIAMIDTTTYSYQLTFTPGAKDNSHILWGAKVSYTNVTGHSRRFSCQFTTFLRSIQPPVGAFSQLLDQTLLRIGILLNRTWYDRPEKGLKS